MGRFSGGLRWATLGAIAAGLAACSAPSQTSTQAPPSADGTGVTVFVNARVLTMNEDAPRAEALAIRDGLIIAVGESEATEALFDENATVRDLDGQTLLPGLIDAHGHFGIGASTAVMADLQPSPAGDVDTLGALRATLEAWRIANPASPWILGFGYDDSLLAENRHPTRDDLDAISADVPILLLHVSAHLLTCNTPCLEAAGISAQTPDPLGGIIRRKPGTQEPDGVLEERAMQLALAKMPAPTPETAMAAMAANQSIYLRNGITTAQEGAGNPVLFGGIAAFGKTGNLKLDIVGYQLMQGTSELSASFAPSQDYTDHFRLGGIKLVLDGSPQGKTAWLSEPYHVIPTGNPDDYAGYGTMDAAEVESLLATAFERNVQVLAHANGDAAGDQLLAGVERARGVHGPADRRTVMIHAQTARDDQLDRMKASGIIPSFYVAHTFFWGDWHRDSVLGPNRAKRISPLRSSLDRDMVLTIHNDSPVVPPDMMRLIWTAVNRQTRSGDVLGPDERISPMEALRAMTIDAAYQYFEEDSKGSLEIGKRADLVILSADPTEIDPLAIADIVVLETIKDGATVYVSENTS